MKILVINVAPEGYCSMKQTLEEEARFIQETYASPGTQVECCFPENLAGAGAIHLKQMKAGAVCGFSHHVLAPTLVKKALEAQEKGYDAVVQTNTNDPGVEASRFVVRIPVVGIGKASAHLASILADRIGVIAPFDTSIPNIHRVLQLYGVSGSISSIVAANPPTGAGRNLEEVLRCFERAGVKCLEDGAQILLPLCGVFIPMTFPARALSERVGVQVIDPLAVGMGLAELFVRFGLTHSAKAYPSLTKIMSSEISSS